jgi:protein-S-isoprenylcysteine O-methyltransferase Ste14
MTARIATLAYGAIAYLTFLASLAYTVFFLAGVAVPKGVDDGPDGPAWLAVVVDLALLSLFAVQHSVMARPWFKRAWTRVVPAPAERSTYVLASSAVVGLLLWLWRPLPEQVWSVDPTWARALLWTGYVAGWGLGLFSTCLLGHFDLFGLKQALARWRSTPYAEGDFRTPSLYRYVRHPLMVGFLIAFWCAPDMSVGRLLFVAAASAYIVVGVRFEEHDLRAQLGDVYVRYAAEVPRFVPRPRAGLATAPPPRPHWAREER